jgi:hypothetical protein
MNRPANIAILALAAIAAVWAERTFLRAGYTEVSSTPAPITSPAPVAQLEGRILSVDPAAEVDGVRSMTRKASVKLPSGEIVPALVGGCIVFPGQTARLTKRGSGREAVYVIAENGRNDG